MRYLLRTNTSYKHLAKKFERTVFTCVGRDGSEMAVSLRRFFARKRFLASENGLYELADTFCHVAPDSDCGILVLLTHLHEQLLTTLQSSKIAEVESSRASLRTHFEVLGLGLEASSPRKLACPRLEDSTIF